MLKKILLISLLLIGVLEATTITTNKTTYNTNENITATYTGTTNGQKDWIAIYPKNASNAWGNVLQWHWIKGKVNGTTNFTKLPIGEYEVRVFFNNTFQDKAKKAFRVTGGGASTIITNKNRYILHENVTVTFTNVLGNTKDWLAIYPVDSSNAWENVIGWKWTNGQKNGHVTFNNNNLPKGNYEVRLFFKNTFKDEARYPFKIEGVEGDTTITTNKATYTSNENIITTYKNTTNGQKDWIAIYPKNSSNAWGNVIKWQWITGKVNGTSTFTKLPIGDYEVRVFFNNTFQDEARKVFRVENRQRDVYIIQGQSNAFAFRGVNLPLNNKVKSFGTAVSNANMVKNDLNWYTGQSNNNPTSGKGFIGKWGMKMSSNLANSLNMPLVVLNGAVGGTRIDQHLKDNANPENLNTIYGRLLYRAKKAHVANEARILFWYQGESDGSSQAKTSIATYKNRFKKLYTSWKNDYRNLEKIYMFQVRSGCGTPILIMEAQRQLANEYDDIIMMSTTGTNTETLADKCHYTMNGYMELANRMERLVKNDLYNIAQTEAHPPEVKSIKFTNNKKSVILTLKEAQNMHLVGNPKKDFIVENTNIKVTSINILNQTKIKLNFSNTLTNNAKLTYFGHRGNENSWVQNSNKLGLITFYKLPIEN